MPKKKKQKRKNKKQTYPSNAGFQDTGSSQAVELGLKHHQAGNLIKAETLYKKALEKNPNNADAYHFLGILANRTGKSELAIDLIKKALDINPNNDTAHNNLGVTLERANRLDEAIVSYQKALSIRPGFASTHNNLGNTLVKANRTEEAISYYQKAVSLDPAFVSAWNNLGIILRKNGRLDEAIQCYNKAISAQPDYVDAYNNLGNVLEEKGQLDQAISIYQKALSISPEHADLHNNLGVALKNANRVDEAVSTLNRAIALQPDFAEAYNNLGNVLEKTGRSDEAIQCYTKAISIQPGYAQAHCNLGIELEKTGRMEEALVCFKKTLILKPDHIEAHRHLSKSVRHTHYDKDIAAMESLYKQGDLSNEQKMLLCFALGKAFEDLKEFEKSFDFILEANRLKRASYQYDISGDQARFNSIKNIFNPDFFPAYKGAGFSDNTPIFILGMPRTGSTLVEQILSSHPQVFGAGELKDLELAGNGLTLTRETGEFGNAASHINPDEFKKIGADYIRRIRHYSRNALHITDKMPHNFLHIGLIRTILPDAKIIHCKRDPMDTCLSIFKNYFSEKNSHKYAYDLKELGRYYNLYLDLMAHWQDTLPGFVYEIQYEKLISDQAVQTRRLLEFCELSWNDACLDFHTAQRKVSTASAVQVRQPIYKDSLRLWEQYKNQLEPLRKILFG